MEKRLNIVIGLLALMAIAQGAMLFTLQKPKSASDAAQPLCAKLKGADRSKCESAFDGNRSIRGKRVPINSNRD